MYWDRNRRTKMWECEVYTHNLHFELHCIEFRLECDGPIVGLVQEGGDIADVANYLRWEKERECKVGIVILDDNRITTEKAT